MPAPSQDTPSLHTLGYDSYFEEMFAGLDGELFPARVVGQHRRQWDVISKDGLERAVLAGRRWGPDRDENDAQPTIGDWVALSRVEGDSGDPQLPVIEHVLTRRTFLSRLSPSRRGKKQIVVANVDLVAVVAAFSGKDSRASANERSMNPRRIERYLTAVRQGRAEPLVVLNKADLGEDPEAEARALTERLDGVRVVIVSAMSDEGMAPLISQMTPGLTVGFVGMSGVGKSSLINQLLGREAAKTGAGRTADARGRHTTTHRELFVTTSGALLIDTPGMREFSLTEAEQSDLEAFGDVSELATTCKFRDCTHHQEPGCAVRQAVQAGSLTADRVSSFQSLSAEFIVKGKEAKVTAGPSPKRRAEQRAARRRPGSWENE